MFLSLYVFFLLVASISFSYFFLLVVIALWVFWSMWFLMLITITLFFYSPSHDHLVDILVMAPSVHWYCFLIYSFWSWSPCWSPCCDFKCSLVSPFFLLLVVILFLGVCYRTICGWFWVWQISRMYLRHIWNWFLAGQIWDWFWGRQTWELILWGLI